MPAKLSPRDISRPIVHVVSRDSTSILPDFSAVPPAGTSLTREQPGTMHAAQRSVHPPYPGEYSNVMRANVSREQTGTTRAAQGSSSPPYPREQTGTMRAAQGSSSPPDPREQTGTTRVAHGHNTP